MMRSALMIAVVCLMAGCDDGSSDRGVGWRTDAPHGSMPPGFDGFKERWNKRTKLWLEEQIDGLRAKINAKRDRLRATADEQEKTSLAKELAEETKTLEALQYRLREGDYIRIMTSSDIPDDLVWEDGMENPELGDPAAKKGGTIRMAVPGSYPGTFRPFGPNSNHYFRGQMYDLIEMTLIGLHPETGRAIPALAERWAVAPDGRTVFFRLFEDASYSDGAPVRAIDFLAGLYVTTSEYAGEMFYTTFYRENFSHITIYDDRTLAVTLPTPKPLLPYYASLLNPCPTHFYSEFGPNFVEKYQWRVPPTTGAYTVDPGGTVRGKSIVMKRVKDWWAKDKKFYRYRYNVDQLVYHFIADESKALELFRIGEIDTYVMVKPELWHDRMEIPEVHDGYIKRATFYNIFPRVPIGFYLNTAKPPFDDRDVRLGFHHALNVQKVIDVVFRGDYQRLGSYASGYGRFTRTDIRAREFSPEKARECFARAGYTVTTPDGILRKPDGTRLAVELTYSNATPSLMTIMTQLKEDARKCGLDLQLDCLDSTVNFRKVMEKRHQAAYWGWGLNPPHPSLYQGLYSGYAYDAKGNVIPYTNNIFSYSNPDMDKLLTAEREARTEEELERVSHSIQQMLHDEALWVPGWTVEFTRIGYWRWVKWPDSDTTRFSFPAVFEPMESYLYWVDEEVKSETLKARHSGKTYPETDEVFEQYRYADSLRAGSDPRPISAMPVKSDAVSATDREEDKT